MGQNEEPSSKNTAFRRQVPGWHSCHSRESMYIGSHLQEPIVIVQTSEQQCPGRAELRINIFFFTIINILFITLSYSLNLHIDMHKYTYVWVHTQCAQYMYIHALIQFCWCQGSMCTHFKSLNPEVRGCQTWLNIRII